MAAPVNCNDIARVSMDTSEDQPTSDKPSLSKSDKTASDTSALILSAAGAPSSRPMGVTDRSVTIVDRSEITLSQEIQDRTQDPKFNRNPFLDCGTDERR